MSIQESRRAKFETWVRANWENESLATFADGTYQGFTLQHVWKAWNAALDSVVVKWPAAEKRPVAPDTYQRGFYDGLEVASHACREAIEAAGIRVEVKS